VVLELELMAEYMKWILRGTHFAAIGAPVVGRSFDAAAVAPADATSRLLANITVASRCAVHLGTENPETGFMPLT
jgi:hypothetical protein